MDLLTALPAIRPSVRRFTADQWAQAVVRAESGRTVRHMQANAPAGAVLELEWEAITDEQVEQLLAVWDASYSTYGNVQPVPDTVIGAADGLAEYLAQPYPGCFWRFDDPPDVEALKPGRHTVRIRLKSRRLPDLFAAAPDVMPPEPPEENPCFVSASIGSDLFNLSIVNGWSSFIFDNGSLVATFPNPGNTNQPVVAKFDPEGNLLWTKVYSPLPIGSAERGITGDPESGRIWIFALGIAAGVIAEVSGSNGETIRAVGWPANTGGYDVNVSYVKAFNRLYVTPQSGTANSISCLDADSLLPIRYGIFNGTDAGDQDRQNSHFYHVKAYDAGSVLALGVFSNSSALIVARFTPDLDFIFFYQWYYGLTDGLGVLDFYVDEFGNTHVLLGKKEGVAVLTLQYVLLSGPTFNFATRKQLLNFPEQSASVFHASIARYDEDHLVVAFDDANALLMRLDNQEIVWAVGRTPRTLIGSGGFRVVPSGDLKSGRRLATDGKTAGFFLFTDDSPFNAARIVYSLPSGGARGVTLDSQSARILDLNFVTWYEHGATWDPMTDIAVGVPLVPIATSPSPIGVPGVEPVSFIPTSAWTVASDFAPFNTLAATAPCEYPVTADCGSWLAYTSRDSLPDYGGNYTTSIDSNRSPCIIHALNDGGCIFGVSYRSVDYSTNSKAYMLIQRYSVNGANLWSRVYEWTVPDEPIITVWPCLCADNDGAKAFFVHSAQGLDGDARIVVSVLDGADGGLLKTINVPLPTNVSGSSYISRLTNAYWAPLAQRLYLFAVDPADGYRIPKSWIVCVDPVTDAVTQFAATGNNYHVSGVTELNENEVIISLHTNVSPYRQLFVQASNDLQQINSSVAFQTTGLGGRIYVRNMAISVVNNDTYRIAAVYARTTQTYYIVELVSSLGELSVVNCWTVFSISATNIALNYSEAALNGDVFSFQIDKGLYSFDLSTGVFTQRTYIDGSSVVLATYGKPLNPEQGIFYAGYILNATGVGDLPRPLLLQSTLEVGAIPSVLAVTEGASTVAELSLQTDYRAPHAHLLPAASEVVVVPEPAAISFVAVGTEANTLPPPIDQEIEPPTISLDTDTCTL